MYILNGVTASANTGYIIDTNAASSDLTGVSTATDIVLDNDGGYEYSNISSVDIGFDIIYLTDPILEGVAGENYILYRKTQDFTGTSANLLLDTGTDFSATSAHPRTLWKTPPWPDHTPTPRC
jgi:hypothetical protein